MRDAKETGPKELGGRLGSGPRCQPWYPQPWDPHLEASTCHSILLLQKTGQRSLRVIPSLTSHPYGWKLGMGRVSEDYIFRSSSSWKPSGEKFFSSQVRVWNCFLRSLSEREGVFPAASPGPCWKLFLASLVMGSLKETFQEGLESPFYIHDPAT